MTVRKQNFVRRRTLAIGATTIAIVAALATIAGRGTAQSSASASGRRHPLQDVSAIIEADIAEVHYTYDETTGPRTVATLKNAKAHRGSMPDTLEVSQLGGPLPDGTTMGVSELQTLHPGSRYVFFFGPPEWFFTPIWSNFAFKVESFSDGDVVLGPDGTAVTNVDVSGISLGSTVVTDPATQSDPQKPISRGAAISKAAQLRGALNKAQFIETAANTISQVGGAFAKPKLSLTPRTNWRLTPTLPSR